MHTDQLSRPIMSERVADQPLVSTRGLLFVGSALSMGALFLQPVKHRWPCPEHIMAKWAGPSNAENNPNTNHNPNLNIYTAT